MKWVERGQRWRAKRVPRHGQRRVVEVLQVYGPGGSQCFVYVRGIEGCGGRTSSIRFSRFHELFEPEEVAAP